MIEQLIKMKKQEQKNDVIRMIDEFILYEKLSGIKALGDIKDSVALQKKLPLLANLLKGDFYSLSLAIIVRDILEQLDYELPSAIYEYLVDIPERTMKQLHLAGESSVDVTFANIIEYRHKNDKDKVVGVFTNAQEDYIDSHRIVIIVQQPHKKYIIYQGSYEDTGDEEEDIENIVSDIEPYTIELDKGELEIKAYSIQGNNSHPFATYRTRDEKFHISMPSNRHIQLSKDFRSVWDPIKKKIAVDPIDVELTIEEINQLGMFRQNVRDSTKMLGRVINRWEGKR